MGKITIYKNVMDLSSPFFREIDVAIERIREGKNKDLIEQIRKESSKEKQNLLKRNLTSYCFSGTFRQRTDEGIIQHSGFICLDYDKFETTELLNESRKLLMASEYTYCLFISPSGKGLKQIVKVPAEVKYHRAYFKALDKHFNHPNFDKGCINESRVCYESYDKDIFVNNNSIIFDKREEHEQFNNLETTPTLALKSTNQIINILEKWFNKKYSMSNGNRNNNLFKLVSAFNDAGVNKNEAETYFTKYIQDDFNEKEINNLINNAYSKKEKFGTVFFEDMKTIEEIETKVKSGTDKKKIVKHYSGQYTEEQIDNVIQSINEVVSISEFWQFDKKGNVKIKHHSFKLFLEQQGFFKLYPSESPNFIFVKVENNLIENTNNDKIKSFVLNYLEQQKSLLPYELVASSSKLFKDDYLNLIKETKVCFHEDTIDTGVIYFQNGALLIKKEHFELIDYFNLDGFVWKDQIIKRNFKKVNFNNCVYAKFINLVAGNDDSKIESIKSVIGYLLHSFKTSSNNKAIIINDETISDNPNGGSGKGIFWNALKQMKNIVDIDGKQFDFNKSFIFQRVNADTQVLVFDDVKKNFEFEFLFSLITEGITIEKKNKYAIKIPINKSPKILITTNYTIGGVGGSFDRRKFEVEFSSYFNANHTPLNEFKHLLFDEWDEEEWHKFDCFMIHCLQLYLEKGLCRFDFKNLEVRKLHKTTSVEFVEWCDDNHLRLNERLTKATLYNEFINDFPDYKKWLTQKKFKIWLDTIGKFNNLNIEHGISNGDRYVLFTNK